MKHYKTKRNLSYSDSKIFDLICDIERYSDFQPWCKKASIYNKVDNEFYSDITVGFNIINETFTSKVFIKRPKEVVSEATSGPFKKMINKWNIKPITDNSCEVSLVIEYEFKSIFLKKLIGVFFDQATKKMISAFEQRAKYLYG